MTGTLKRKTEMEDKIVKFAFATPNHEILATLIHSKDFADEMELRICANGDRFKIGGHKIIMDSWTEGFTLNKIIEHIKRQGHESALYNAGIIIK